MMVLSFRRRIVRGIWLAEVNRHYIVVRIRVHKVLVDKCARGDDTRDSTVVHQTTRLDLLRRVIWELLRYGYITVEVLDKELEETVQLKKGKPSLIRSIRLNVHEAQVFDSA